MVAGSMASDCCWTNCRLRLRGFRQDSFPSEIQSRNFTLIETRDREMTERPHVDVRFVERVVASDQPWKPPGMVRSLA